MSSVGVPLALAVGWRRCPARDFCFLLLLFLFSALPGSAGASLSPVWTYRAPTGILAGMATNGSDVAFADTNGTLRVFDGHRGTMSWEVQLDALPASPFTFDGRILYFGSFDGRCMALDVTTGTIKWSLKLGSWALGTPVLAGTVPCFGSADGFLNAVNPDTGKLSWRFQAGSQVAGSPVYDGQRGLLYVPAESGTVSALQANHRPAWEYEAGGQVYTLVLTPFGLAGFAVDHAVSDSSSPNNRVFMLNPDDGSLIWEHTLDPGEQSYVPLLFGGNRLFVGTIKGIVVALDAATGKEAWRTQENEFPILGAMAQAEGLLFVGHTDGKVLVLSQKNGSLLDSYNTGSMMQADLAYKFGRLFIGDFSGTVTCLEITPERYDRKPAILLAGQYWDPASGALQFLAYSRTPSGELPVKVEILTGGQASGVFLLDDGFSGDGGRSDGLFGLVIPLPPEDQGYGQMLLQMRALTAQERSTPWPFLQVLP